MIHLLLTLRRMPSPSGGFWPTNSFFEHTLRRACTAAGADIRGLLTHQFTPQGFSAVILLAESHASVHTWPEKGHVFVDYFSCAANPKVESFCDVWVENGFEVWTREEVER